MGPAIGFTIGLAVGALLAMIVQRKASGSPTEPCGCQEIEATSSPCRTDWAYCARRLHRSVLTDFVWATFKFWTRR